MPRIALASSMSFMLAVASCAPSGGGTGGSTGSSGSSVGSAGNTGGNAGGNTGGSSAQGTSNGGSGSGSTTGGNAGVTTGSNGGSSGGSSAGGACTEADDEPCQLNAGYGFCCSGICTDSLSDPENCGQCYNYCLPSQICSQGSCDYANCDGAQNGALCAGNAGSQDPSQQCVGGVCVATSCGGIAGYAECALTGGDAGVGSCCEGQCIGANDPLNCGGCGAECPVGATCSDGACSSSCVGAACPSGTVCSQSEYASTVCLSPSCVGLPDEQGCAAGGGIGGNCCGQICIDTQNDPLNCGQCGIFCPSGTLCLYGTCEATAASCSTAYVGSLCQQPDGGVGNCCGTCGQIDFQTDPSNCGACGQICSQGATCVAGQCVLADGGYGDCYEPGNVCPAGDACVDSACATETCGAANAMETCQGADGLGACCGSTCVDTDDDSANCGLCGTVCPTGMFCSGGGCVAAQACGADNSGIACPLASNKAGVCCSGQCVDTTTDSNNCEGCGVACPLGEVCSRGIEPPCALPDGGTPPSCYDNGATCPSGTVCSNGECLPPICAPGSSGVHCAFGTSAVGICCGGVCSDTTQDPQNCGSCGTTCASGICYASIGEAQCLPSTDGGDCGGANGGFGCLPGTDCLAGNCVSAGGCSGPFGICQAGDGNVGACCQNFFGTMCTDLASDPQNCGNCGEPCPSGQTCANGLCSGTVSPCGSGRHDAYCDLDAGTSLLCCPGGGCADIETDPANCGYCGSPCQSGVSCIGGQCVATTCSSGTAGQVCEEGDGGQGACCGTSCLDVSADPDNCGGCGVKCAAVESCQVGACVIAQCSPAYQGAPCDVDGGGYLYVGSCCGNGCVDLTSDPANCGLCGSSCGDAGCNAGSCQ